MNEADFSTQVYDLLKLYHWRWTHFRPARTEKGWYTALTGDPGMLDIIAARKPRLLFLELKGDKGNLTAEESGWAEELIGCPLCEVYIWWPNNPGLEAMVEVLR